MSHPTVVPTDARPALRRVSLRASGAAHYQRADQLDGTPTLVTLCGRRPLFRFSTPETWRGVCSTCERIAGPE